MGPHERAAHRERQNVSFTPLQYTDAFKSVRTNRPPDYLIVRTAPMDERGCFNLSLACSWENDAIRWYRDHAPSTQIVVEVNPRMPRVYGLPALGNNEVSLADVSLIVEDDTPLPDFTTPEPTLVDRQIAANVAALVDDRATIQFGIGTIPMVIGRLLADRKELGIHSELFCQSHLDLIEAGSVTNAHKGLHDGVSVATFALGEERLYRWLAENRAFAMLPVTRGQRGAGAGPGAADDQHQQHLDDRPQRPGLLLTAWVTRPTAAWAAPSSSPTGRSFPPAARASSACRRRRGCGTGARCRTSWCATRRERGSRSRSIASTGW